MRHTPRIRRAADHPAPSASSPIGSRIRVPSRGTAQLFGGLVFGGLLFGGLLLAGCGSHDAAPPAVAIAPAELPSATAAGSAVATVPPTAAHPSPTPAPDGTVRLPWPAPDPGAVAQLQRSVDSGAEPWLLDPAEVAVSYVSTAHGWDKAEAQARPGGTTVDVAESGRKLTLTLTQPGRTGRGGIWVVTAESAG